MKKRVYVGIAGLLLLALAALYYRYAVSSLPSSSMAPTIPPGASVIIDKTAYSSLLKRRTPERFDIIVFKYPVDVKQRFAKRVVGLPGETIEFKNGNILIDGTEAAVPAVLKNRRYGAAPATVLADDEYFVVGDNVENSVDSRHFGPVAGRLIVGKAIKVVP